MVSTFTTSNQSRHAIAAIKAEAKKRKRAEDKARALAMWSEEMAKLDAEDAENDPFFQQELSRWEAEREFGGLQGLKAWQAGF